MYVHVFISQYGLSDIFFLHTAAGEVWHWIQIKDFKQILIKFYYIE